MTTYTAISIGPIDKTLSQMRRSRELWGASYLFSYISRRIIEKLEADNSLVMPIINKAEINKQGAGFYPDKIILQGSFKDKISEIENEIIKEISENSELSEDYLKNFLRFSVVEIKLNDKDNIMTEIDKFINSAELKEKYFQDISDIKWNKAVDNLNGKLFYTKAFDKNDNQFQFPSLLQIATEQDFNNADFNKLNNDDENSQKEFINTLKAGDSKKFRNYHKYVAVVQADGDNIGKTIGKIGSDPEKIQKFSMALGEFSVAATQTITNYGGKPVYSGGDDLLFFAPIAVNKTDKLESIFKLIEDIDNAFEANIIENAYLKDECYAKGVEKPSMSYGISIAYYKFPLNESRDFAYENMMNAKNSGKNSICFKLRKHSGQTMTALINKGKEKSYRKFLFLINNIPLNKKANDKQEKFVTSVIYKLRELDKLLVELAKIQESTRLQRMKIFFEQEFEIDLEKDGEKAKFINKVVEYYYQLTTDFPEDNKELPAMENEENSSNLGKLYSALRFINHLISEENE